MRVSIDTQESKLIRQSSNLNKRSSFHATVSITLRKYAKSHLSRESSVVILGSSYSTIDACSQNHE